MRDSRLAVNSEVVFLVVLLTWGDAGVDRLCPITVVLLDKRTRFDVMVVSKICGRRHAIHNASEAASDSPD